MHLLDIEDKQEKKIKKQKQPKEKKFKKEKINKEKKPVNRKKIWIIVSFAVILFVVAAAALIIFLKSKSENIKTEQFINAVSDANPDAVSAYGVINIGTIDETLDVENMSSTLEIEEIMVSSGDVVTEGDALVRFDSDSVSAAREELEKNLREAELEYRKGAIEYEQSLITAKYNYDLAILEGEQADAIYNETLASLKESLKESEETYNDAVEKLSEYKDAQENNTYYTDYKVEYYKQIYDENLDVLKKKMEEWGVPWPDVTGGGARLGADTYSQYKYILQSLYKILEKNLQDYETALENYENDMADLSYNLLSLQLEMSSLEENYLNAKKNYESSLLTAEQTRQTAKTNAELAESEYEAKVAKAETDFDSLKSAYEDAENDLDIFNARMVDCNYIASNSGTVMRTAIRSNSTVTAGTKILTYKDLSDVTVSVSVDQSDIAKLSVGDEAVIYESGIGMLTGTIKAISPVTQSSSMSQVTYSVTVKVENSADTISSNTTVTVLFGIDMTKASEINFSENYQDNSLENGMPDFGNMPDMGDIPDFNGSQNFGGFPGN